LKMKSAIKYFSLIKFSHTVFALPFAFVGFFLGVRVLMNEMNSNADVLSVGWLLKKFLLMLLCMVFARTAAMAFNRLVDEKFDALNPRTKGREIPSGQISKKNALYLILISSLSFITCTWFINQLCFLLSPVALLVVLGYSYTKRFTALCHFILGIGLGLAPIGAFLTITGEFALLPLLFSFSVLFWVSGFDIIYALQDDSFDKENQLHSIPAMLGRKNALVLSRFLHFFSAILILIAGFQFNFHPLYWLGSVLFCAFLVFQHRLVKPHDLSRVNLAFFTLNGIASVVFGLITLAAIFIKR
jgi:4-hydroxybenzoate polyprenyltransferase